MTNSNPGSNPGPLIWTFLVLLGVIWGASFPAITIALEGFRPFSIAAYRISMAAIALFVLAFAFSDGLPTMRTAIGRRVWLHAFGAALFFNALPFTLLGWGQQFVTAGFAGITMAVVPLFLLPMAHMMVPGELMSRAKVYGFLLGFAGVVILIGPSALSASGNEMESLARLACLGGAACYAIGNIITRLAPPVAQLSFSAATLLLAALMSLPIALSVDGIPQDVPMKAYGAIIYLGILPTAVAAILLVKIIKTAGSSFLVLVNFQVPIWAALMGIFFLGETLQPQFIIALLLILAGLAVSQRRKVT